MGSIIYKEKPISHEEYLECKYQSISSSGGEHKARITYVGDKIDAGATYSHKYIVDYLSRHPEGSDDWYMSSYFMGAYGRYMNTGKASGKSGIEDKPKKEKVNAKREEPRMQVQRIDNEDDDLKASSDTNEDITEKIFLFPFRAIWWLIKGLLKILWAITKMVLSVVTFGLLSSFLNRDD